MLSWNIVAWDDKPPSYFQSPDVSRIVVDGVDWSSDCSSDSVAQVSSLGDLLGLDCRHQKKKKIKQY